jgi:hypothetical protein
MTRYNIHRSMRSSTTPSNDCAAEVTHGTKLVALLASSLPLLAGAQELTPAQVDGPPSARRAIARIDHPAIGYGQAPTNDAVGELDKRLAAGSATLKFDPESGYLKSVLEALRISPESQVVVYSKTSVQAPRINPSNPRALYFSDDVVVGYIRDAPLIEFATLDPQKGVAFYVLNQKDSPTPRIAFGRDCLRCHESLTTMDVPGMLLRSVPTGPDGKIFPQLGNFVIDHRSPLEQRWGGWYVTGAAGNSRHMGNILLKDPQNPDARIALSGLVLKTLAERFDLRGYLGPYSDLAALMVLEHQMHMTNLLVRMGWDTRVALASPDRSETRRRLIDTLLANDARELVDYMLFIDEAPLSGAIQTTSGFAAEFSARGPVDKRGRSLRQLDLKQRLARYPLSYMIYAAAFDALPPESRDAIYKRLWEVLSAKEQDRRYARLSTADRKAVLEILRDTKSDLPSWFK